MNFELNKKNVQSENLNETSQKEIYRKYTETTVVLCYTETELVNYYWCLVHGLTFVVVPVCIYAPLVLSGVSASRQPVRTS